MSFQDLENNGQRGSSALKIQSKQRQHEDASAEHLIKVNIQKMQENARIASEQLERAQRTRISKRVSEGLTKALERSQDLARETEQLFRDWTLHLAGEPRVRHLKKFAFDKLEKAFKEEVTSLKDARRRAMAIHKEADVAERRCRDAGAVGREEFPDRPCSPSEEERCLLDAMENAQFSTIGEDNVSIQALKRSEVMKHIQGHQFVAIDVPVDSPISKSARAEMKQTVERRRSQLERFCIALLLVTMVVYFMVMRHLHPRGVSLTSFAGFTPESASASPSSLILGNLRLVPLGGER